MKRARRSPACVLWGKLEWHPAVVAWRALVSDTPDPESITEFRTRSRSVTYRLAGAGPDGGPILARRSPMMKALIERVLYERILPRLPFPLPFKAPRCYGFRADGPQFGWLFIEDT